MDILALIAAFGGGIIGAYMGALPAFIMTGIYALVGGVLTAAGVGGDVAVNYLAFGSFVGPHIAFAGGVAAAGYAGRKGKLASGTDILSSLNGLESYKIDVGTPFFVKYGRVGVMDEISELTGATVTCTLIGERPGLITAESMSAYIAYKATVGMPEARRTVVSNIHRAGTIPAEAGAHIAEIIKIMLDKKASGTDLKL